MVRIRIHSVLSLHYMNKTSIKIDMYCVDYDFEPMYIMFNVRKASLWLSHY